MPDPILDRADLDALIERAKVSYKAMSPAERDVMHAAQRRSWARAELMFGSDADEARYRDATDEERRRLDAEAKAKVASLLDRAP